MNKVLAITQARSGSKRLPGKILEEINGKTLLQMHIGRVKSASLVSTLVIATTTNKEDDVVEKLCSNFDIICFRGSEDDVLDRFYQAAKSHEADYIVRLTADCPLIDPVLIDEVISNAITSSADYCSNTLKPTFPDGQDVEVFTFNALKLAWEQAALLSEREHVTPYIWKNSTFNKGNLFKSVNVYASDTDYSKVRLTVDERQDLEVIRFLVNAIGEHKTWSEYAEFYLNNNEISKLNQNFRRNEGYTRSIGQD